MSDAVKSIDYSAFETNKPLLQVIPSDKMHLMLWENHSNKSRLHQTLV